jgi:hypothetical protein
MAYTKYSLTPANNTATPPDGAPEGMLPSAVNDTMRDMMAQIRDVGDGIRGGTYTMTAPVITGGSITGVALSGNTFTNPVITGGSINNTPIGASTANTGAFTTLSATGATTFSGATVVSGSLTANTFSSSGATITGGTINNTAIGGTTAAAGKFTTLEATGVTTVQAGTVSAPAITTSGDTNTGIFFPAADTIAFAEGGAEAMRIDSSGRVGIGTSTPATLLHLYGTVPVIRFEDTDAGGAYTNISANTSSGSLTIDVDPTAAASGSYFRIDTDGVERLAIDSTATVLNETGADVDFRIESDTKTNAFFLDGATGFIGLNTGTPLTAVDIAGSMGNGSVYTASISGTTMDVTAVSSGTIAVGDLVFGANIQPGTRITALGTGTGSTGTYTVSVSQTAASGTVYSGGNAYGTNILRITSTDTSVVAGQPDGIIQFYGSDNNSPAAGVGAYIAAVSEDTNPDTALVFGTRDDLGVGVDANERMRITSTGNVGIGTSSPSTALQVNGTGSQTTTLQTPFSIYATTSGTAANGFGTTIELGAEASDGSNYAQTTINSIWTDATAATRSSALTFSTRANAGAVTERMRIDSSGNVGIGTTAPQAVLDLGTGTAGRGLTWGGNTGANRYASIFAPFSNGGIVLSASFHGSTSADSYINSYTGTTYANGIRLNTFGANGIQFFTDGSASKTAGDAFTPTERMRIDSSGNVGIGTSSPTSLGSGYRTIEIKGGTGSNGGFCLVTSGDGVTTGQLGVAGTVAYVGSRTNHPLAFTTNNTERMRIDSSGNVLVGITSARANAGDVQVSKGISFPATQSAQSDANTLDDYEEGTFTPTVIGATTAGTASYTAQNARYTKIGRVVQFEIYMAWSSGTGTGGLRITGLPFTSANSTTYPAVAVSYPHNIALAANNVICAFVQINTTSIDVYQYPVGGGASQFVTYDADGDIMLCGTYSV